MTLPLNFGPDAATWFWLPDLRLENLPPRFLPPRKPLPPLRPEKDELDPLVLVFPALVSLIALVQVLKQLGTRLGARSGQPVW